MEDWDYEMWWDAINGMEEDENYDDMDDWQALRPTNFPEFITQTEAATFFRTSFVRKFEIKFLAIFRE